MLSNKDYLYQLSEWTQQGRKDLIRRSARLRFTHRYAKKTIQNAEVDLPTFAEKLFNPASQV